MNWLKPYKSSNLLLYIIIFYISFPTTATRFFQLRTYPTTVEVSHQYLLTMKIQCSNLSKMYNFSLHKKRCAATIKPKPLPMILQSLQFILFCVRKMILYQIVVRISKILFLLMTSYTSLTMRKTFFTETPTNIRQSNRERNNISRSCEKPQPIPSNNQHTYSVDEQHSSNIFLNPYNFWDKVAAALMSLNHTNNTYSMFKQYTQPTTQQPRKDSYPVFSSLRTMNSERKGLRVSFAFFQRNYLTDGRKNETVAKVEELSDLWKPGAMDGTPPFVMICNGI